MMPTKASLARNSAKAEPAIKASSPKKVIDFFYLLKLQNNQSKKIKKTQQTKKAAKPVTAIITPSLEKVINFF